MYRCHMILASVYKSLQPPFRPDRSEYVEGAIQSVIAGNEISTFLVVQIQSIRIKL
jgi:hypothetical protein